MSVSLRSPVEAGRAFAFSKPFSRASGAALVPLTELRLQFSGIGWPAGSSGIAGGPCGLARVSAFFGVPDVCDEVLI